MVVEEQQNDGNNEIIRITIIKKEIIIEMIERNNYNNYKNKNQIIRNIINRVDLKRMDEQLETHIDQAWTSESETTIKDWEIDCGKLVIKTFIDTGAFGSVYRGTYDGQDVAVKILDLGNEKKKATLRKIFLQEISIWSKLDHPNIAKFVGARRGISSMDVFVECGMEMPRNAWCLVVEFVPGGTLKSYLMKNKSKRLSFKAIIQFALDIAKGLSYLHAKKIVHRDVKTENMLLDSAGRVKITDFGVSRFESLNPVEMTGQTGTLGYMAPEVLRGNGYNHKCDVYSFGICLWEIYCCALPYSEMNRSEKTSAVIYEDKRPEIPERCPSNLAKMMKLCWDKDPKRRPEMREVVNMLEDIDTDDNKNLITLGRLKNCFRFVRHRSTC